MAEKKNIIWATGRRKTAVARIRLFPGAGTVTVNERTLENYFPRDTARMRILEPFDNPQQADTGCVASIQPPAYTVSPPR